MHVCACVCVCVNVHVCVCVCVSVSPPSCINGDLAIAGEANTKLCMSHLMVKVHVGLQVPTPSSMRYVQPSCGVLVPSPGGFVCTDSHAVPV